MNAPWTRADVNAAVALLQETNVITPGTALAHARGLVLADLARLHEIEDRIGHAPRSVSVQQRMGTVEAGSTVVGYVAGRPRRDT